MADQDAISLVYKESRRYTEAIERCLEAMAGITLSREHNGPIVWSLLEKQAFFAIYEVAARCYELGAASIGFSHEVIAFLSDPGEINGATPHSQSLPLAAAFEVTTVASTEFQKAAKTALDAISALTKSGLIEGRRTVLELHSNLCRNLHDIPRFHPGYWAKKLGVILSSLNAGEIAVTGIKLDNATVFFQGHVARVCLYESLLIEIFGPSRTAKIDSPLMSTLHQEVLPGAADYVGVLANYVENDNQGCCWDIDNMREMLDENVISILMHLETHLSDFLDEMALLLSEILTHYAAVFMFLLKTYSSTLAVKQYLDELIRSDTHLLALNPSDAFQPLLTHREVSQRALTKIQSDVDFLVSRLKQLQEYSETNGWPTPPENIPESLKCFKDAIITLLSHSETVLPRQIHQWKWLTSDINSGVTFLHAIRPLLLRTWRPLGNDATIFIDSFLYHQESAANLAGLETQLQRIFQPPSSLHFAFGPHDDPQMFWTKLSSLARSLRPRKRCTRVRSSHSAGKSQDHWRTSTHIQQLEYRVRSLQVKSRFQANGQGNPTEVSNLPKLPLNSKRTFGNASLKGGSFQGDWSF